MKTKFLFPNRFKRIGWMLLVPSAILGIANIYFDFKLKFLDLKVLEIYWGGGMNFPPFQHSRLPSIGFVKNNITDEICGILFIIGALFVAFSKEKLEDEFIAETRLESLVWATYINYAILILCFLFIYDMEFMNVMILNMFSILIFFIIRFNYILYKTRKSLSHEK